MTSTNVSRELLDQARRTCFSAVISDACDQVGLRQRCLRGGVFRPLTNDGSPVLGFARTVYAVPVHAPPPSPYAEEIAFMDSLRPDDLVIGSCPGAGAATWGELFSAAAIARGAVGTVMEGLVRDVARTARLGYPVFAIGTHPADSLARCSFRHVDAPVAVAGVEVRPGDLIVADDDGVVAVPNAVAEEVLRRAVVKVTAESKARALLETGSTMAEAWEASCPLTGQARQPGDQPDEDH